MKGSYLPPGGTSGIINPFQALEVDTEDLSRFTEHMSAFFGRTDFSGPFPCEGDLDWDGDVDGADLAIITQYNDSSKKRTSRPRSLPVNGVTEKNSPRRREGHRPR